MPKCRGSRGGAALNDHCECGHLWMVHPIGRPCTMCELEGIQRAFETLAKCGICLALVSPPDKADHERWHRTHSNLRMADQRERWESGVGS